MQKLAMTLLFAVSLPTSTALAGTPVMNSLSTEQGQVEVLATAYGSVLAVHGSSDTLTSADANGMVRVGISDRTDLGLALGTDGAVFSARWGSVVRQGTRGPTWSLVPSIGGSINRRPDAARRGAGIVGAVRGTVGFATGGGEFLVSSEVELWHVQRAELTNRFTRFGVAGTVGYAANLWGPTQLMPWVQAQHYRANLQLERQPIPYNMSGVTAGLSLVIGRSTRRTAEYPG